MKTPCLCLLLLHMLSVSAQENSKKDTAVLKTVTVVSTKNPFTYKNGNLQVNIENSLLSSIPDPLDLLGKIPTVQVARDGESISVVGKGEPLVYIDNQRSSINDVKSLSVADIKSIELINSPSSKYEANGRVVLLITRKTNNKEGTRADIQQTFAYRKYYLNRTSANVSVRKKRLELKGDLQFNELKTWEGNDFAFDVKKNNIFSGYKVTAVTTRKPQVIGSAGAFYQINERDYVSVGSNFRSQTDKFPILTNSTLKDQTQDENVITSNYNRQPVRYQSTNLNYNKSLKKFKGNLFAGAQYTGFNKGTVSSIFNAYNGGPTELSQNRDRNARIKVFATRIDLEKNLAKDLKLETGIATSFARSNGYSNIQSFDANPGVNAIYSYREQNYAAYSQMSGTLNKISYSGGLRLESADVFSKYNSDNNGSSMIEKKNTKLFPKAKISVPIDSASSITVSYSKTIDRPNYTNADQTAIYINPYFEWTNNINIDPSLQQSIAATFQYRKYGLEVVLYQARGPVYSNFTFHDQQLLLERSEKNFEMERAIFVTGTVPFRYKIWNSTNVLNLIFKSVRDPEALIGRSRPVLYFTSNNDLSFPHNYTLNISGWAVTKSEQSVITNSAMFSVDTSLTRKMNNFSCTLRWQNIFRSINSREAFTISDVAANGIFYDNSREVSLAVKYTLGKLKESRYRNRDVDESGNRVR